MHYSQLFCLSIYQLFNNLSICYIIHIFTLGVYGVAVPHSRALNGVSQSDHLNQCNLFTCVLICLNDDNCGGVNFKSLDSDVCVCELVAPINHGGPTLNTDIGWTYYLLS